MSKEKLALTLKNNWDAPLRAPHGNVIDEGYFAGRQRETTLLIYEILHRKSGSILISGHRGVGKTSLVYKALSEIKKKDKNTIVVLLNAAQLEADSDNNPINPKQIIENLIRRLYSITKDNDSLSNELKNNIRNIYRKAVATEFNLVEQKQELAEAKLTQTREERIDVFFDEKNIRNIIYLACWAIAVALQYVKWQGYEWLSKLLPLLFALPIPFLVNLKYKKSQEEKKVNNSQQKAEELYQFDNSIGNLEFDLEQIHASLSEQQKKLIYVIDELDKLETKKVKELLKFYKNLFTLSDAIFIFIGGEDMYQIGAEPAAENNYRSRESTYFTSKYFLSRPLWADLSKYLEEIISKSCLSANDLETFKRAICFEAKNDFFDMKTALKDRVNDYDETGCPIVLSAKKDGDIIKARLHKAITILFEGKYMIDSRSRWQENERLLRKMFDHSNKLCNAYYAGIAYADPVDGNIDASLTRDFNGLLYRLGVFSISEDRTININGVAVPVRHYGTTGNIPIEPPNLLNDPTEFENRFVAEFKKYIQYILVYINAFRTLKQESEIDEDALHENPSASVQLLNNWAFDAWSLYQSQVPVFNNLRKSPPHPYKREDIEQRTKQISNHCNSLAESAAGMIPRMLQQLLPGLNLQLKNLQNDGQLFSGSASQIRNAYNSVNPLVLYKADYSRQAIFALEHIHEAKTLKNQIQDNSKSHRLVSVMREFDNFKADGFYCVSTGNSKKLEENIISVVGQLRDFFTSNN